MLYPVPVRRLLFHPITVLTCALAVALAFALFTLWRYSGQMQVFLLYYYTPIVVPFVAFVFDRVERWPAISQRQRLVDWPVLSLALIRAVILIPYISGHALFLTYTLLTTRSWIARLTAALVMYQVIYIKVFAWQDNTLIGGILLGAAAGWIHRKLEEKAK